MLTPAESSDVVSSMTTVSKLLGGMEFCAFSSKATDKTMNVR